MCNLCFWILRLEFIVFFFRDFQSRVGEEKSPAAGSSYHLNLSNHLAEHASIQNLCDYWGSELYWRAICGRMLPNFVHFRQAWPYDQYNYGRCRGEGKGRKCLPPLLMPLMLLSLIIFCLFVCILLIHILDC